MDVLARLWCAFGHLVSPWKRPELEVSGAYVRAALVLLPQAQERRGEEGHALCKKSAHQSHYLGDRLDHCCELASVQDGGG